MEVLVSLILGLLLLSGGWRILGVHRMVAAELVGRAERLETEHIVGWVLSRELRHGGGGDRGAAEGDSVPLRAFRGGGTVCGATDGLVRVRYRGSRRPDPEKDSVLLLGSDGRWRPHELTATDTGRCDDGGLEPAEAWTLDPPPESGVVLVRLFERGSYHVADGALRYRRGPGGRQPLTPAVLGPGSGLGGGRGTVWAVLESGLDPEPRPGVRLRRVVRTFRGADP